MNQYYYCDDKGQSIGPVDLNGLINAGIQPETLIWSSGAWVKAYTLPELKNYFSNQQPTTPPPPNMNNPHSNNKDSWNVNNQNNWNNNNQGNWNNNQGSWNNNQYGQGGPNNGNVKPQNWLWLGIVATVLCCLPLGIVSIVYSTKVDPAWNRGDYQGAIENAKKAQMWGFISIGAGFLSFIVFFIIGMAS